MSRRRRQRTETNSSLDLLLDTICNTFGGIIFLAILVAVLLQFSGAAPFETPATTSDESVRALETEIAALERSIARRLPAATVLYWT